MRIIEDLLWESIRHLEQSRHTYDVAPLHSAARKSALKAMDAIIGKVTVPGAQIAYVELSKVMAYVDAIMTIYEARNYPLDKQLSLSRARRMFEFIRNEMMHAMFPQETAA